MGFEEFVENLHRRLRTLIQLMFVVESTKEKASIGMIYTCNTSFIDRFAYLFIYLSPQYTARGIGPEAAYLMGNYLFAYFGFRKVDAEIFDYNPVSLKTCLQNGFIEEGCLKTHRWFGDRYWDLHIFSITRESFKNLATSVFTETTESTRS